MDWTKMYPEILEMICKRLTIPDQARFGFTCRAWHSATTDKAHIWVPDTPWIVTNERNKPEYTLTSLTDGRDFKMKKEAMEGTYIVGSCKGWVIVRLPTDDMFILNIFSRAGYNLPPNNTNQNLIKSVPLVFTMSTCAYLNPITIAGVTVKKSLVWCTFGDTIWKDGKETVEGVGDDGDGGDDDDDYDEGYVNVAFQNDRLYAIKEDGETIDVFEVDRTKPHLIPHRTVVRALSPKPSNLFDLYLVESAGDLLVVIKYCDQSRGVRTRPISAGGAIDFEIFKVGEGTDVLVNVESLQGQALFLSDFYCESVSAKHCPGHHEDGIYYITEHVDETHYEKGCFKVDDRSLVKEIFKEHLTTDSVSFVWLLPRYIFNCNCHPPQI